MHDEIRGAMKGYFEHVLRPAVTLMERRASDGSAVQGGGYSGSRSSGSGGSGGGLGDDGGGRPGMVLTLADVTTATALVGRREIGTARWVEQSCASEDGGGGSAASLAVLWLLFRRLDGFEPGLAALVKAAVWARPLQMALRQYEYAPFSEHRTMRASGLSW
jgi:hypothetical protein